MILVIGNGPSKSRADETYWGSVAAALQERGHDVKLTTDIIRLRNKANYTDSPLQAARRWISRNSLRRMAGQGVKIICAMGAEGQNDYFWWLWWVNVMKFVFKGGSRAVAAVLQAESLRRDFSRLHVAVVEVRETKEDASAPNLDGLIDSLKPFTIPFSREDESMMTHAWSSEKVFLFGRTGSGKSTTAQMLTRGHLDPSAIVFKASSCARGVTSEIQRAEGRGWHVTDTPGFGEAKSGTVSSKEATDIIKKFIGNIGGSYSHYVYVVKKDRVDRYDERLWRFFQKVLVGAETNFSVVVTGCEQPLSTEDEEHLKKTFAGCNTITGVNFPPTNTDDAELEEDHKEERAESLVELEDAFARLGVSECSCDEGYYSKENLKFERSGGRSLFGTVEGDLLHYLIFRPLAAVGRYRHVSEIDESFILLPQ